MSPDDPRHGQPRGYSAGCREACCKRAHALDVKLGRLRKVEGKPRSVPAVGAQRRLQALMAMGWTSTEIGIAAGMRNRDRVLQVMHGQGGKPCTWVTRATHDQIAAVFDSLSRVQPELTWVRRRTKNIAARNGYLPPAAWDDIDLDPEPPTAEPVDVDEVVVDRIIAGDRLPATPAEKAEVVRRWLAAGRPLAHLEALTGWNGNRERLRATQKGVA